MTDYEVCAYMCRSEQSCLPKAPGGRFMHNEIPVKLMTIGELAQRIGVHIETVRRWERSGIIPPATRRRGRRVYGQEDVAHIEATVFEAPGERQELR